MKTINYLIMALMILKASITSAQGQTINVKNEEVSFKSGDAVYSGTFSVPDDNKSHPLVILVSGMGPQDRDWAFAGGKFKMACILADYLNQRGIAVYRYDDRGFGKSTGTAEGLMSFNDLALDMERAVAYFRTRPGIGKIGLCGHSLGGILSVMAASEDNDIDFIITLSGAFQNGADILREQAATLKRWRTSDSMSEKEVIDNGINFANNLVSYAKYGTGIDSIRSTLTALVNYQVSKIPPAKMVENLKRFKDTADLVKQSFDEAFAFYTSPHQKSYMLYDASSDFSKIKCPVLTMFGSMDKHVVVGSHLPKVLDGVRNSSISDLTIRIVPGADHGYTNSTLMKTGKMIPGTLEFIADWISSRTSADPQ